MSGISGITGGIVRRAEHSSTAGRSESRWSGSVFLWGGNSLYLGAAAQTSAHAAHEIKLCIALGGSFRLRTGANARWKSYRTAIIPSQQLHQLDGTGTHLCLFYFPPEVSERERLRRTGVREVPAPTLKRVLPRLNFFLDNGCGIDEAIDLGSEFVGNLCREVGARVALDSRVAGALEKLRDERDERPCLAEISRAVALSESRLAHLFREQTGTSLRRYALELRLRRALIAMARDPSLTRAAHDSGFADSAHLSRTFRSMVGLSPSALTKNSRFVAR